MKTIITISPRNVQHSSGMFRVSLYLRKYCKEFTQEQIRFIPCISEHFEVVETSSGSIVVCQDNSRAFTIDPKETVVIIRGGIRRYEKTVKSILLLHKSQCIFVNSWESMLKCNDKYFTYLLLNQQHIDTPTSVLLEKKDNKNVSQIIQKTGWEYPIVLKTLNGSLGVGVMRLDSHESLVSVCDYVLSRERDCLIQEYMDLDFDIRTIVCDGKIIASMRRDKLVGDFRSNFSLGSEVQPHELTQVESDMILKTSNAFGCGYCGIDHTWDKKTSTFKVIEVNSSPGSVGIEKVHGNIVIKSLFDYCLRLLGV